MFSELENNIDFENEKLNNTNKAKSKSPEANNGLPYPSETLSIEKSPSNEECNKSDDESSKESFHIENKDWLENMQLDDLNGFSEEENQEDDEEPKSKKPKTSDELTSNSSISSKCSTPQLKETETDGTILLENKDNIGDADDINNSEETARNNITESASKKGVQDNDAHNSSNNNNNNHNHNSSNSNNNDSNSSSSSSNNINNNNDNTINCNSETLNNNTSDTICNEDNKIVGNETPEKMNNKKSMEIDVTPDSNSEKSHTPELPNEEGKSLEVKKRYFLRSKTCKGSSEEPEEILKKVDGTDSVKQTPGKGLGKATPSSTLSVSRRPRTRAVSKLRLSENEDDMDSQKKNDAGEEENEVLDDECAFMLGFDDSISD